MPTLKITDKLDFIEKITKIASSLSIIFGIIIAVLQIYIAVEANSQTAKSMKLSTLPHIERIIKVDNKIRAKIGEFLNDRKKNNIMELVKQYKTGERAYLSKDFSAIRDIGRHYEMIGALVKHKYIEFDFLYAVISFPEDFWEETQKFREYIRNVNWSKEGNGLPNFWENFEYLHKCYNKKHNGYNC